ncbi:MAG: SUF system NifU family Fe-S cluster assembly protein [Myxococcota bacterium]
MADLRELYQEVILDHTKRPRNFGQLPEPSHRAEGHNPLCGDHLTVTLEITDDCIERVLFEGSGCSISTASASLMTQMIAGKTTDEVSELFEKFHGAVTSSSDSAVDVAALGKLVALAGVRGFPMRVKCASLAWHTLVAAIRGDEEHVTTE